MKKPHSSQESSDGRIKDGCRLYAASSALAGSAIGALASLATTWLTQHSQTRTAQRLQDRARREALYVEFIREASKLFGDAFDHELDDPAKFVHLYALVSTMLSLPDRRR